MSVTMEVKGVFPAPHIKVLRVVHFPGTRQWAIETNGIGTLVMVHPGALYPLYGPTPPRKKEVDGDEWIEGHRAWGRIRS